MTTPEELKSKIDSWSKELSLARKIPNIFVLSIVVLVISLLALYFIAAKYKNYWLFSPGKLNTAHHFIENDCKVCHLGNKQDLNKQCVSCHNLSEHSKELATITSSVSLIAPSCIDCHIAHNNDSINANISKQCTTCHNFVAKGLPDGKLQSFDNLSAHPDIKLILTEHKIKYSHFNTPAHVNLDCKSCHDLDSKMGNFKQVNYETSCKTCHKLTFDERLTGTEAPHANANQVYSFLHSLYSNLYLKGEGQFDPSKKPKYKERVGSTNGLSKFLSDLIFAEARYSEKTLFESGACKVCHNPSTTSEGLSYYEVKAEQNKSNLDSKFKHALHLNLDCRTCHNNPIEKVSFKACASCHTDQGSAINKIKSDCTSCHNYHHSLARSSEQNEYLFGLINVL